MGICLVCMCGCDPLRAWFYDKWGVMSCVCMCGSVRVVFVRNNLNIINVVIIFVHALFRLFFFRILLFVLCKNAMSIKKGNRGYNVHMEQNNSLCLLSFIHQHYHIECVQFVCCVCMCIAYFGRCNETFIKLNMPGMVVT